MMVPMSPRLRGLRRVALVPTVLAFAALGLAGCGGGEQTPDLSGLSISDSIDVVGTEMAFDPDRIAVEAGQIPVTLRNQGTVVHDFRVEQQPFLVEAQPGETATDTITLEPGTYEFFCSLPGHREAGMEGILEVR